MTGQTENTYDLHVLYSGKAPTFILEQNTFHSVPPPFWEVASKVAVRGEKYRGEVYAHFNYL